ncbi:MAG: DUF4443 domain-containing protein [Candidatus Nanohaloarchaea archaeon]|nr:DUF4443 domain-containing protein [Candidatus Nanohaloarchaea archaeon]
MLEELDSLNVPRYYAVAALYHIGNEEIGRRRLAGEIGLTESKTRTMLDHMRDAGYITARETLTLTEEGATIYDELEDRIKQIAPVDLTYLGVDDTSLAALVSDTEVEDEVMLRDEAVRAGATGMTVLHYDGGFHLPSDPGEAAPKEGQDDLDHLDETFSGAAPDDIVLVVSAGEIEAATAGLWRTVLSILES